jgi:putative Ca2+/H+ antiporter (TMEM165/GDT1 family)
VQCSPNFQDLRLHQQDQSDVPHTSFEHNSKLDNHINAPESTLQHDDDPSSNPPHRSNRWFSKELAIFTSTFVTIFLAELGDKTQVATLLMSAESESPWLIFAGAGAALVLTTFLGVLLGCWLSKRIAVKALETTVGVILLVVSVMLLWDIVSL